MSPNVTSAKACRARTSWCVYAGFVIPAVLFGLMPMHATPGDQPPPLTRSRLLTEWSPDGWLILALVALGVLYLWGVVVLRRRGVIWSPARTVSFIFGGLGSAAVATMSALGAYDTVLFSVHMVQHMILMMATPLFLALGAPVTLALRTLPSRPRKVLLKLLHSRYARVLSFPPLALALFIATPFALYYSPMYEISLQSEFWHNFVHGHFVAIGALLMWPLVGVDPVPGKISYPLRLVMMFVMLPSHAILGITIMSATTLFAEDWYLAFNRTWKPSPLDDQYLGGAILWGSGDFVALTLLVVLFVQWFAESKREAAREDRRLDRIDAAAARYDQPSARGATPASQSSSKDEHG